MYELYYFSTRILYDCTKKDIDEYKRMAIANGLYKDAEFLRIKLPSWHFVKLYLSKEREKQKTKTREKLVEFLLKDNPAYIF